MACWAFLQRLSMFSLAMDRPPSWPRGCWEASLLDYIGVNIWLSTAKPAARGFCLVSAPFLASKGRLAMASVNRASHLTPCRVHHSSLIMPVSIDRTASNNPDPASLAEESWEALPAII